MEIRPTGVGGKDGFSVRKTIFKKGAQKLSRNQPKLRSFGKFDSKYSLHLFITTQKN
jgi:hypothetical protein